MFRERPRLDTGIERILESEEVRGSMDLRGLEEGAHLELKRATADQLTSEITALEQELTTQLRAESAVLEERLGSLYHHVSSGKQFSVQHGTGTLSFARTRGRLRLDYTDQEGRHTVLSYSALKPWNRVSVKAEQEAKQPMARTYRALPNLRDSTIVWGALGSIPGILLGTGVEKLLGQYDNPTTLLISTGAGVAVATACTIWKGFRNDIYTSESMEARERYLQGISSFSLKEIYKLPLERGKPMLDALSSMVACAVSGAADQAYFSGRKHAYGVRESPDLNALRERREVLTHLAEKRKG